MRVFGYAKRACPEEDLLEMKEVTFAADPDVLRRIAVFLSSQADELEVDNEEYAHGHLQFCWDGWSEEYADVVVVNPSSVKEG